ncbi:hypothetical protein ACE1CI_30210 [Aerosakkonemataceae cyanobacterium BLCC-F50]|uniref:Uncharacterized protein n=1 Tax=Floridaenema flaviceps BLCC-F50 TaxID=3153642 RepID=A0ABV4XZP4_9CYAN
MTFQTAKIQALIAEIDAVLSKDSKFRFSWLVGDGNADRQMLQRVRQQLQKWQEQLTIVQATGAETQVAEIASYQIWVEQTDASDERSLLSESLETEIALLQQQKQELLNEIRQLQQQRQALIEPEVLVEQQQFITEFSQELINRLQETVNQQLAETLEKIQAVQLLNQEVETTWQQETESPKLQFIELETTAINPELELIGASVKPLPYAGVELTKEISTASVEALPDNGVELTTEISENLENADFIISQLKQNDTISALTDLIEDAAETTASPEEDLLTTDLAVTKPKVDLWLGNNIVEQLNEDLSELEAVEQLEVLPPEGIIETITSATESNDLDLNEDLYELGGVEQLEVLPLEDIIETISDATDSIDFDLAAAVEQEQEKINAAIPEDILAEFEDLFGDSNSSSMAVINAELNPSETPELAPNQESVEAEKKN